ncbi:MAG: flavin reductase family protein [Streptosporangiaceae bacterium]
MSAVTDLTPYRAQLDMPEPAVPGELFLQFMKLFPSAVSVVTSLDFEGMPRGLTCSAACSVSMDPPTMLVCVNERNGSLAAIRESGGFVVNLLRSDRRHISDLFASNSPNKYRGLAWQPCPDSGMPWLPEDALAYVECQVVADVTAGSHAVLIGLVTGGRSNPAEAGPLVYWDRTYGRWSAGVPA